MMSDSLKIILHGTGGDLSAKAFLKVVRETLWALEELADDTSKGIWLIGELSRENPASIELIKQDAHAPEARLFVEGIRQLETGGKRPERFSDNALGHVKKMTGVLYEGVSSLVFTNGTENPVRISQVAAATIDKVSLPPNYTAYTELEGRLEAINVHGSAQFWIYDPITNDAIQCRFDSKDAELLGSKLMHRIRVTGSATFNRKHAPTKINVDKWEEIGTDSISTAELHSFGLKVDDDRASEDIIRYLRRLDG